MLRQWTKQTLSSATIRRIASAIELQPRRWPTVGRFQPWAAASEQAEGSGWTKGNTEKEEENNTTTLR